MVCDDNEQQYVCVNHSLYNNIELSNFIKKKRVKSLHSYILITYIIVIGENKEEGNYQSCFRICNYGQERDTKRNNNTTVKNEVH